MTLGTAYRGTGYCSARDALIPGDAWRDPVTESLCASLVPVTGPSRLNLVRVHPGRGAPAHRCPSQ